MFVGMKDHAAAEIFISQEVLQSLYYNFYGDTYFMQKNKQRESADILMCVARDTVGLPKSEYIACAIRSLNNPLSGNIKEIQISQDKVWSALIDTYHLSEDEIPQFLASVIYQSDRPEVVSLFKKHKFSPM